MDFIYFQTRQDFAMGVCLYGGISLPGDGHMTSLVTYIANRTLTSNL